MLINKPIMHLPHRSSQTHRLINRCVFRLWASRRKKHNTTTNEYKQEAKVIWQRCTKWLRVSDRLTDWRTDTAHIGNNSLHLRHSTQPKNWTAIGLLSENANSNMAKPIETQASFDAFYNIPPEKTDLSYSSCISITILLIPMRDRCCCCCMRMWHETTWVEVEQKRV